jgi:hypothetical protein
MTTTLHVAYPHIPKETGDHDKVSLATKSKSYFTVLQNNLLKKNRIYPPILVRK